MLADILVMFVQDCGEQKPEDGRDCIRISVLVWVNGCGVFLDVMHEEVKQNVLAKEENTRRRKREKMKKATKKIEGPLWGYMVTQRGVVVDVLQHLRLVEQDGTADGKPATMVRIFDPSAAEKEGVIIDNYESLDTHRRLILYEGYYRGPQTGDIHIDRVAYDEEKS